jgi:hypothetical protein
LLTDNDEDDGAILGEMDEPAAPAAKAATAQGQSASAKPVVRTVAPRWP